MIKKVLVQILVTIMLICSAAFTLSACGPDDTKQPDSQPEQSTENGDEESSDNSEEENGSRQNGIWTPPAKQ